MEAITEAALLKRINRRLGHRNEYMRKARTWTTDLGWYYVIELHCGNVVAAHQDPEELAREEGLLRPGECVQNGATAAVA